MGKNRSNINIALSIVALLASMILLTFASVPIYNLFCKATGFGGTTQRANPYIKVEKGTRKIKVEFNANVDKNHRVAGIVTDGDLRRHIKDELTTLKAKNVMTTFPQNITSNSLATEALFIMNDKAITVLPVIESTKLIGVIHIHDILKAGVS